MINEISSLLDEITDIDPRWESSPFLKFKRATAKVKGSYGEKICKHILKAKGFAVEKPKNTDHDLIVDGVKTEIKTSTLTKRTDDCFSFLQIRNWQDYDSLILQCLYFDSIEGYKLDKRDIADFANEGVFKFQHGGRKHNEDASRKIFCYNGNMSRFSDKLLYRVENK